MIVDRLEAVNSSYGVFMTPKAALLPSPQANSGGLGVMDAELANCCDRVVVGWAVRLLVSGALRDVLKVCCQLTPPCRGGGTRQ